jgi:hypothetical protein
MIIKSGPRGPHDLNHRPLNGWPGKVEEFLLLAPDPHLYVPCVR